MYEGFIEHSLDGAVPTLRTYKLASVPRGLTEKQARDAGLDVRVGVAPLDESSRGFVHGPGNEGVVKVVVDAARGVLVGATFVGPAGGESVSGLGVAVRAEVPVDVLRNSIYAYPTFWRAVETALADAGGLRDALAQARADHRPRVKLHPCGHAAGRIAGTGVTRRSGCGCWRSRGTCHTDRRPLRHMRRVRRTSCLQLQPTPRVVSAPVSAVPRCAP